MADTVKEICAEALEGRIRDIGNKLRGAKECLKDGDFLQCAVRLEGIGNSVKFDDFEMRIFEIESGV